MKLYLIRMWSLILFSATLAAAGQQPKISAAKEAEIRELMNVTGMSDIVERQMGQMAEQVKPLLERSLPPGQQRHEIVETFSKKFLARANSEGLIQQVIPVYDKFLTDDDIRAVIEFYRSPVGQHLLKIMPEMMKEANAAGQRYGEQVAQEVLDEMAQQYPELRQ